MPHRCKHLLDYMRFKEPVHYASPVSQSARSPLLQYTHTFLVSLHRAYSHSDWLTSSLLPPIKQSEQRRSLRTGTPRCVWITSLEHVSSLRTWQSTFPPHLTPPRNRDPRSTITKASTPRTATPLRFVLSVLNAFGKYRHRSREEISAPTIASFMTPESR